MGWRASNSRKFVVGDFVGVADRDSCNEVHRSRAMASMPGLRSRALICAI